MEEKKKKKRPRFHMYGRRWRSNIDRKKQSLFENVNGTHSIMPVKRRAEITSPTGPNHNGPLKWAPHHILSLPIAPSVLTIYTFLL
ncbi:hypothetical protein CFP56_013821 [Quercus suber]|uniref:Transmembrane protein n=1 Tax=Quercus suber TaxID=58331 RepID=A0AAW0M2S0_QUESU